MRMGSYFVEIYTTKILPVFLYIPTTERADSGNACRGMFGLKTHCFFKEKNCFRMSEFSGKFPELENSLASMFIFAVSLCVCFFLRARAELFGTRPSIKQKKKCAYPKLLWGKNGTPPDRTTVLYCTVLYCTVLYCTVLYCTVLYCTVLYCTVLYCTVLYCTVLYCTVLYCTVLYCTVLYCTVLYCTVLYCTVLYCTVLYCTVLYCTVLYCTVLYCTVLYCTVLCRNLTDCTVIYTDFLDSKVEFLVLAMLPG